jgi:MATE family multidrug resistance protein
MSELRTIARHAGTVLVGQLATISFGVADTMIAGRYRTDALAALSVGSAIYISIFVALSGLVQAQLPVWAELRGARREAEVGRSVRQALYLGLAAAACGIALLLFPGPLLQWAQVPPELDQEVQRYLGILALALPPALLFRTFSTLNQALGKPVLVTWLQTASLAVKVPLSYWLTFGGAGVPAMGLAGCAWATVIVNCLLLALAVWAIRSQAFYRPFRLWQRMEPPQWDVLRGFARLGVPTALAVMVEVTSFTLMALFIARLGTQASASHQIASNLTAVLYQLPLSLGIAVSARVSYWLGRGDGARARLALRLGYKLGLGIAACNALVVLVGRDVIPRLYAGDNPAVVEVAAGLLAWVAVYHIADTLQALGVFVLRSYGVATRPLVVYCVLLWGAGLGGGYLLAYQGLGPVRAMQSPAAFWAAGAFALALTATAFFILLWQVVRSRRTSPA